MYAPFCDGCPALDKQDEPPRERVEHSCPGDVEPGEMKAIEFGALWWADDGVVVAWKPKGGK